MYRNIIARVTVTVIFFAPRSHQVAVLVAHRSVLPREDLSQGKKLLADIQQESLGTSGYWELFAYTVMGACPMVVCSVGNMCWISDQGDSNDYDM